MTNAPEQTTVTVTPAPPAEAKTTDQPSEHMIPKSRFDEVNTRLQQLLTKEQEREAQERAETEKRAKEQGRFEELLKTRTQELDALKPQVETATSRAQAFESVMVEQVKERVKGLSADAREAFALLGDDVLVQFKALPTFEKWSTTQRSPGTSPGPRGNGAQTVPSAGNDEEARASQNTIFRRF